jgi:hypothetical protein
MYHRSLAAGIAASQRSAGKRGTVVMAAPAAGVRAPLSPRMLLSS